MIVTSLCLIFGGAVLFYLLERNNALLGLNQNETVLASLFQSVTCRTAGFNSIDVSQLHPATSILMMMLMFVGGSPGSTAGGIKTTTFAVLMIYIYSIITNKNEAHIFNRRFDDQTIKKASSVLLMNMFFIVTAAMIVFALQPELMFQDVMFELFSALGTVGISTGITRELTTISRIAVIVLMYSGRVGGLTLALSLTRRKRISKCHNPSEKIAIG